MSLTAQHHREAEALVGRRLGLCLPEERRADLDHALAEGLRSSGLSSPEAYLAWLAGLS